MRGAYDLPQDHNPSLSTIAPRSPVTRDKSTATIICTDKNGTTSTLARYDQLEGVSDVRAYRVHRDQRHDSSDSLKARVDRHLKAARRPIVAVMRSIPE